MEQSRHKSVHYKYLVVLISIFAAGTLFDTMTLHLTGFAIGGTGASLAMIVAIILMYRYTGERFSLESLIRMLRFVKPRFPTIWDKLITVGLVIVAIIASFIIFSNSINNLNLSILLYAISAAIIPPAVEELANRGFIQTSLERIGYSFWWVIGMSTFIFSISHYPVNPSSIGITVIAGLIFGIVTARTRSVIIPFVLHGLWNFSVVIF